MYIHTHTPTHQSVVIELYAKLDIQRHTAISKAADTESGWQLFGFILDKPLQWSFRFQCDISVLANVQATTTVHRCRWLSLSLRHQILQH